MKPARDYYEDLLRDLRNPEEAAAYLNAALEAGDQKAFLMALRNVLAARLGMTKAARKTKISDLFRQNFQHFFDCGSLGSSQKFD